MTMLRPSPLDRELCPITCPEPSQGVEKVVLSWCCRYAQPLIGENTVFAVTYSASLFMSRICVGGVVPKL